MGAGRPLRSQAPAFSGSPVLLGSPGALQAVPGLAHVPAGCTGAPGEPAQRLPGGAACPGHVPGGLGCRDQPERRCWQPGLCRGLVPAGPVSPGLAGLQRRVLGALGGWRGAGMCCAPLVLRAGPRALPAGWQEVPRPGEAALMAGECGCIRALPVQRGPVPACPRLRQELRQRSRPGGRLPRGAVRLSAAGVLSPHRLLCRDRWGSPWVHLLGNLLRRCWGAAERGAQPADASPARRAARRGQRRLPWLLLGHKLGDDLSGRPLGPWLMAAEPPRLLELFALWSLLRTPFLPLPAWLCPGEHGPPGVSRLGSSSGEACRGKPLWLVLFRVLRPRGLCAQLVGLCAQLVGLWAPCCSGGAGAALALSLGMRRCQLRRSLPCSRVTLAGQSCS